jgi:hypothetical protein
MSPRQKTALKNRAQGDLPEGESGRFDAGVDDGPTSAPGTIETSTSVPRETSPALTEKQRKKKRGVPKKEVSGGSSDAGNISSHHLPPTSLPSSPKNLSTIDSSSTTSKEFIDALTESVGKNALQLVAKAKGRSQQLTFDALIKGATKLELCSLKGKTLQTKGPTGHGNKPSFESASGSGTEKAAPKKKRKNGSEKNPTTVTTNDAVEKMESALKGLGKLEGEVMNALFPTDGSLPQSYELIANRFGMSVEEVKGIADNALRGLRGAKGPNGRISTVWN